jgi:hypothetical protein
VYASIDAYGVYRARISDVWYTSGTPQDKKTFMWVLTSHVKRSVLWYTGTAGRKAAELVATK